jgi:hypothetical protein
VQTQQWRVFTVLIVILALSACSHGGSFLLYIDPYAFEALGGQDIGAAAIRQSLPKDLGVKIEVSPQMSEAADAARRFQQVVEHTKPAWIYLSPGHPFNPGEIIPAYPEVRFFRERPAGEKFTGGSPANQIALVYDREQANYESGRAIAALLGDEQFLQQIGFGGSGTADPRVGILAAVNTEFVQREIDAFVAGFSELEDPQRVETKVIGNFTDRVKARRLLDGMREQAVAVVLLKTYVLSGFCLEYLSKSSGVAIVEGPIPGQAYGDTVLLVLMDDFIGALQRMAETMDGESPAGIDGPVTAPVQLQWNKTYRAAVNRVLEGGKQQ